MDGVGASASTAANKKPLLQPSQHRGVTDASIRNLLFEQLLTFSVPVQTIAEPQQAVPDLPLPEENSPKEPENPTAEGQDEELEATEDSSIVSIAVPQLYDSFKPAPTLGDPRQPTNDVCALPKDTKARSPESIQAKPVQVNIPVADQDTEVVADQAIIAPELSPTVDVKSSQSDEAILAQNGESTDTSSRGRKGVSNGEACRRSIHPCRN